ncbi:MAG TPA: SDR family oxidoreductase [Segetibacter sp.]
MNPTLKLKGQSALVTGASSGIGEAVALALANEGANVVVNCSSHPDRGQKVVDQIKSTGGNAIVFQADVSKEEEVTAMFQAMYKEFGTIDILVNNAGLQQDAPLIEMTLAQWQKVIDVNLTGQFLCAREAAKEFVKRGIVAERSVAAGKIICMSSVHDIIPWAGHVNYAASKGGVMLLMKTIAQELAPKKIRVNSISPGAIKTRINESEMETQEEIDKILTLIPYKRIGEPRDVGNLAVWLASDESDYITGATIYIDGGMTLYPGFDGNG